LVVASLDVIASTIACLERIVSEMTSSGTVNPSYLGYSVTQRRIKLRTLEFFS